jgi:hypothetical protein
VHRSILAILGAAIAISVLPACQKKEGVSSPPADGSVDVGSKDSGADAPRDTGADSGRDVAADMPRDTPLDQAIEAAADSPAEAPADAPGDTTTDGAGDASDGGGGEPPGPMLVTMDFAGQVATVAGTPLGFDSTVRTAAVSGSFAYDLRIADSNPSSQHGQYLHNGTSVFTFTVAGHMVGGSGLAIVQTDYFDPQLQTPDTFRFLDGKQTSDTVTRIMTFDGAAAPSLSLLIAITRNDLLSSDVEPNPFPAVDITNTAQTTHTFSLTDSGGTLLMQLSSLTMH